MVLSVKPLPRSIANATWRYAVVLACAVIGIVARVALNGSLLSPGERQCYVFASGGLAATIAVVVLAPAVTALVAERYRRRVFIALAAIAAATATFIWSYRTTVFCAPL